MLCLLSYVCSLLLGYLLIITTNIVKSTHLIICLMKMNNGFKFQT